MGKGIAAAAPKTAASAASRWHLVDADGQILGRLSTRITTLLLGKFRADWAPDRDPGQHVVVVNAARVRLTGRKLEQKVYRRHSGQPGGLKEITAGDLLRRHPERVIEFAVAGMLPKSRLGSRMIRRLMVYRGPEHPHSSQNPVPVA